MRAAHEPFADEQAVRSDRYPTRRHTSRPCEDEPAVDASAGAPSPDAGAHPGDDGETLSLTVVDGWAAPERADAERPVDEAASDAWSWSPEPEVAAAPAATWFPEAVLEDSTPDHDHVSVGDAWSAWSDEQGARWTSDQ